MKIGLWLPVVLVLTGPAQALPRRLPGEVAPALFVLIHGCHDSYGHDMRGWHRHGKRCETQRGVARVKRDKKRAI